MQLHHIIIARAAVFAVAALGASAWAAHPLVSDDTGTQGSGHWQLELNTDHTRTRDGATVSREGQANATLTYGLGDDLDLAANLPVMRLSATGTPSESGLGDVAVQAKWRFHDDGKGWTLALKPVLTLPTGNENRGLGQGRAGASLTLLSSWEGLGDWTLLLNAGLAHNANRVGERRSLWSVSAAALYKASPKWTLSADAGASRNPDRASSKADSYGLLGAIYHVDADNDLDIGVKRSLGSGPASYTLGVGWTLRW